MVHIKVFEKTGKTAIFLQMVCLVLLMKGLSNNTCAQSYSHCITQQVNDEAIKANSRQALVRNQLENFTSQFAFQKRITQAPITIPVVFHVIHNNGPEKIAFSQIVDAMRILNEDWNLKNPDTNDVSAPFKNMVANNGFSFVLAKKDPTGKCTIGVNYVQSSLTVNANNNVKALINWDTRKYLNVYVVNSILFGSTSSKGYSYYPGSLPAGDPNDGILIVYNYLGSIGASIGTEQAKRVLTHEVGHTFNLYHTFGKTNGPGVNSNCYTDDGDHVDDTPPTIGVSGSCDLLQSNCDGIVANVENYMDYSTCLRMFTQGQKARILAAANSSVSMRNNWWSDTNLIATLGTTILKPTIIVGGSTNFCSGQGVTLTAPVGYTGYVWSTGETTQSIVAKTDGNYFVSVISGTCTSEVSDFVAVTTFTNATIPTISSPQGTVLCPGGSLTLTASAGTNYLWSNGATTQSTTISSIGTYWVTVGSENGCNAKSSLVNIIGQMPTVTQISPTFGPAGTLVTITGTNFSPTVGNNKVMFGAANAIVISATTTSLLVTVPIGAGAGTISVGSKICGTSGYFYTNSTTSFRPIFCVATFGSNNLGTTINLGTTSATPSVSEVADLDLDGKPDLIVANPTSNSVSVYRNIYSSGQISAGSFATKLDFATGNNPQSIAITDLDGDGKPDIITANYLGNTISILKNTHTSGNFTSASFAAKVDFNTGTNPIKLGLGDMDGDGRTDIVALNQWSKTISVIRNKATPGSIISTSFNSRTDLSFTFASNAGTLNGMVVADLDGDGKPDIAACDPGANTIRIRKNLSTVGNITASTFNGSFSLSVVSNPTNICQMDINRDGFPELAICNDAGITYYKNLAQPGTTLSATFVNRTDIAVPTGTNNIYPVDLDGDARPELVVNNKNANGNFTILKSTLPDSVGTGMYALATIITAAAQPQFTSSADFNQDGKPDLVVVDGNAQMVSIFQNNGGIGSAAKPIITLSGTSQICPSSPVTLTASSGDAWLWNTGETSRSISVSAKGKYAVTTWVGGCQSPPSDSVNISLLAANLAPTITAGGNLSFCDGGQVTLTSSFNGTNLWSNGATTQSIQATLGGNYTVQSFNGNCYSLASNPVTVTVYSTKPIIKTLGATRVCNGSVRLVSSAIQGNNWSNGAKTQSINVSQSGFYSVNTIINGCTSQTSVPVQVIIDTIPAKPVIGPNFSTGTGNICPGGTLQLTSPYPHGNIWSTGDTLSSITIAQPGNYTLQVCNGTCTSSVSNTLIVKQITAPGSAGPISTVSTSFRQDAAYNFSIDSVPLANNYIWQWSGSDGIITNSGRKASVYFGPNASSGLLSVYPAGDCGNGQANFISITINPLSDTLLNGLATVKGSFKNIFVGTNAQIILTGPVKVYGSLVISDGQSLNTGNYSISGPGQFRLEGGGTLTTAHTEGISNNPVKGCIQTTTRIFNDSASFVFNGTSNQNTGNALPSKVLNLTASITQTLSLSVTTSVINRLNIGKGQLDLENQELTLLSSARNTAFLDKVPNGSAIANAVNFKVQLWLNPAQVRNFGPSRGYYQMLGPPVYGQTWQVWAKNNPFTPWTYDHSTPSKSSIQLYDPSDRTWPQNSGWVKPLQPSDIHQPGTGARVWFWENPFFNNGAITEVTGQPVTGNFSYGLKYCADSCASSGNLHTPNGWNLLANPYPAPIHWDSAGWTRQNVSGALYVYSNSEARYRTYLNGVGLNGGSGNIAPFQGFFVEATANNPVLKVSENVKIGKQVSMQRQAASTSPFIRLKVKLNGQTDEMFVINNPNAARGFDLGLDASKISNPHLNLMAEPVSGQWQAICSMPIIPNDTLPITVYSDSTGLASLILDEVFDWNSTFFSVINPVTGQKWVLDSLNTFHFQLISGQPLALLLIIEPKSVSQSQAKNEIRFILFPNPAKDKVNIIYSGNQSADLEIIGTLGDLLLTQSLTGKNETIVLDNFPKGLYIARLRTKSNVLIQRFLLH